MAKGPTATSVSQTKEIQIQISGGDRTEETDTAGS